jgi:hypothetical protein
MRAQGGSHVRIEVRYRHVCGGTEGNPKNDRRLGGWTQIATRCIPISSVYHYHFTNHIHLHHKESTCYSAINCGLRFYFGQQQIQNYCLNEQVSVNILYNYIYIYSVSSTYCGLYVKEVLHLFYDTFYMLCLSHEKKLLNANKLYSNLRITAYLHRTSHQIGV